MTRLLQLVTIAMLWHLGRKLKTMPPTATEEDLNKAIDNLVPSIQTAVHNAVAAETASIVKAIQDKVPVTTVDLTDEVARLNNLATLIAPAIATDVANTLNPQADSTPKDPGTDPEPTPDPEPEPTPDPTPAPEPDPAVIQ